jgi:hypothetical protein
LYVRALAILEKSLGAGHVQVAMVGVRLAEVYRAQGRERKAQKIEAGVGPAAGTMRTKFSFRRSSPSEVSGACGFPAIRPSSPKRIYFGQPLRVVAGVPGATYGLGVRFIF